MSIQPIENPADAPTPESEKAPSPAANSPSISRALPPVHVHTKPKTPKFGEELPLFCEKCGYNLTGLPVKRCDACQTLHFRCPECGHNQVINTLRPAAQRIMGRLRSWAVVWIVFLKLNFFGWCLFGWAAYGYDAIASYTSSYRNNSTYYTTYATRDVDAEELIAIFLVLCLFGIFSRMLLLRWRKSLAVAVGMAAVTSLAFIAGGLLRYYELTKYQGGSRSFSFSIQETLLRMGNLFLGVFAGCLIAWPIWKGAVFLLLPKRTGQSLIAWQKSLSEKDPDPGVAAKLLHH